MGSFDWTPLEVRPLHEGNQPDQWWACSEPERPADKHVCWDYRCRACALHAHATVLNDPTFIFAATAAGPADALVIGVHDRRKLAVAALQELHDVEVGA